MKKGTIFLFVFILIKIILQYVVVNPIYELHRDEFLHLDQAKHLAWGYHSVPPVTSWLSWLILQLGNSLFWIKFFPALFGALTILVVWKTIESLKGSLFSCILASLALIFSVLLRINILYQPNSLDILCWTLVYYNLIRFIQTNNYKWLYFLAISFALGFLNKYNIAFCLLGLLPALVLSKQRKLFTIPQFYYAIILAFIIISPNIVWQIQNDFPVLKHMKELAATQLVHVNRLDFVKEQFFFFVGSFFVLIVAFVSFFSYAPFKPYRLLFWSYIFTIAVFIFLKAKAYYAIGLYPILLAFGAVYLSILLQNGWKFYLRYVAVAHILFLGFLVIKISLPIYSPVTYVQKSLQKKPFSEHTWEDGKKYPIEQDFADMLGWKELAIKTDSVYKNTADKEHVMILCDNYGQAGAINYYTKIKGLKADAFTADYVNWLDLNKEIKTVIRIKTEDNLSNTRDLSLFGGIKEVGKIKSQFAREKGTRIILLSDPKIDLAKLLRQERAAGRLE
ncbi:glycosyltransferase family 39 protein [Pedobacter boryungensis]|uniref:Glycosyltransferase family 39 protein n=1 Tax=Pedobacter boryungensis TaxID=869962 RepID=A0ABX2DHX5_9SPHI|nr:glycosyltransferase family 39 protein [Pedobacter boryungensis]NQX32546.1 glycosyltransferase family 39 protein [Pedobacter boryungensis]